jgi:methylase of polypeptide subunit release factors
VQALLAARHAERVVATDLNPRALGLGRLSAELSGIDNVEWREGNLFEPVGDERFDLVVANPPFVISPTHDLTFRDGGRRGDELSREVVTGVAERLEEGGFGHVLCEWIDEDAPRRWLEASGCDAVVLRADTLDPVAYAMRWTALDAASPQQAAERAERWLPYYAELGIGEISTGAIVLRRRSGTNWVHHDELVSVRGDAGPQLLRIFEGHDLLASLPERRLAFAEGVTLIQRLRGGGGPDRARLTTEQGAALPGRVPPELVPLLLSLDGQKPLAEAAGSGLDAALPAIRDLVRRGYLAEGGR